MKFRFKLFGPLLALFAAAVALAQQQPVVTVGVTDLAVLGDGNNQVAAIILTNSGSGYQVAPAITINPDPLDPGVISPASAVATIDLTGNVSSITITNPGSGYTLRPIVSIAAPTGVSAPGVPGVNAAATAYLGTHFPQPTQNESFGHSGFTIGITALAVGTFPASGFTYHFFANGISLGTATPNPPAGTPATIAWTPPQPGEYFLTVTATDGENEATSLPVRYFATGTALTNPTPNTIVPQGSSVVLQASSMPQPLSGTGGGSGYTSPPTVTILGGGGSGASYTANLTGNVVTSFTEVSGGSGYTSVPVVVITNGGGSGANAAATIDTSPLSPTYGQVTSVNLTGSDTFVQRIEFYSDGVLIGTDFTAPYSLIYTPGNTPITHAIQAIAYDNNGNTIPAYNGSDIIGLTMVPPIGTPPVITISSPADNAVVAVPDVNSGPIPIAVSAGSSGGLVTKVELYVDGALLGTDSTFPYSFTWTPTLVGDYKLIALAYDDKSNVVASSTVTVKIRAQPTVTIVLPTAGTTGSVGTPILLTAAASDSNVIGGGVTKVQFFVDGGFVGESTVPSGNQYSFSWTPTVAETASITALAFNTFGLSTLSASVSVVISSSGGGGGGGPIGNPPDVSVTAPLAGTQLAVNRPVSLVANATDTDGNITSVQFLVNGQTLSTLPAITTYPYTATWTPTSLGTYNLTARATDNDGNAVTSDMIVVTVADIAVGSPPTVLVTYPTAGMQLPVNQVTVITASAMDPDGSVTSVEFFANSTSLGTVTAYPFNKSWTPTSPGTYAITAVGTDNDGNVVTSDKVTVTVADGLLPLPTVALNPTPPASTPINVPITLTASAQAGAGFTLAGVSYYANGVLVGTALTYPYAVVWTPIDLGSHIITAVAVDNVGSSATSLPAAVNVVTGTAPTVSLLSPVNGSTSAVGSPISLSATAALGSGLITQVQFYANGILIGTTTVSDTGQGTNPFFTLEWTPAASGTYTFTAVVTDSAGNRYTTAGSSVTVRANSLPTISLTSPTGSSNYALGSGIVLAAAASDVDGSVAQVKFYANGALLTTLSAGPYTFGWVPTAAGTYQITATATDNSGGVSTSAPRTITVAAGTTATVTLANPALNGTIPVGNDVRLSAVATGGNGPITLMQFFVNGSLVGSDNTSPYSVTWTPAAPGNYKLVAVATDSAGISASSATLTVSVIANATPTVAVLTPANGATVSAGLPLTLTATAADTDGTIANVRFFVNGNVVGTPASTAPYTTTWTPTAAGSYTIIAEASDNSGNVVDSTGHTIVVVVNSAPTVAVLTPANGATATAGLPVTLTATAADTDGTIVSVRYFVNGNAVGTPASSAPYTTTWTPTAAGSYTVIAEATDNSGNVVDSTGHTIVIVANNAPTVSVLTPANGTTATAGLPITLTATAADTDGTIVSVSYLVNGNVVGAPAASSPYSTIWTPTAPGSYTIIAEATDNSGNVVDSTGHTIVIVANSAPTVSVLTPASGTTTVAGVAVSLTAVATDTDGSVANVRFLVNGNEVGLPATTAPYTTPWTPSGAGTYSIVAEATDNGGNIGTSAVRLVTVVANQPPVVALLSPSGSFSTTAGLPVALIANASDPDGSIAQVRFLVNGVPVGAPLTTAPYTATWTPTVGGIFTIVAEATDNLGLISTSAAVSAYVTQNLLPSVAITSPPNGATVRVNNNTTITATASDGDGSINGVEFFANGVSIGATSTYPYRVQWTPKSEGIYRVVAVATDNTGAAATSPTVLLVVSANAGNAIATGNYAGTGESGNFAVVAATGSLATFIARSTTPGVARTYLFSNIPVDVSGGFSLTDDANAVLVSGVVSDTGTSGSFDSGRLTFIGIDTRFFPAATTVASGYYTGTLTSHGSSSLVAIVGIDGSIMIYVSDGDFNDAANGTVNASGAFNLVSTRGNRFTGTVDPLTGLLTGKLSGSDGGDFSGAPATLGGDSGKVSGFGHEVGSNIIAQNGNTFDQVLLTGATASITADPGQITRISFVDLNDDIVQVEFSGAGRLALALDNPSGPAAAVNYNQPGVAYMKGHANLVITGANETTNVSVFSVGRITAFNQALFRSNVNYDGVADIGYITILSTNGKFGGVRTADADYVASQGVAGICAPGVQFLGPVFVGDINAADSASPMLLLGAAGDVRITGGDLWQANGRAVQISGVSQLKFVDGMNSQGVLLQAQSDRSRIEQNGVDVTAQVIVNP